MKVVPVTIRALAPTNDTFVSVTWRDPTRPDWRRLSIAARGVPHLKTGPRRVWRCRGPQQAIADGGNRSPSSLKQQAETESSSLCDPRAEGGSTSGMREQHLPRAESRQISPDAAGVTWLLLSKDRAAREVKSTAQGTTGKG
jgi:hypothetical protein